MLFTSINKFRQTTQFEYFIYLLVLFFIWTVNGCVTTEMRYVTGKNLAKQEDYVIVKVFMKDGSVIDLRGKPARYFNEYNGQKNVIVYSNPVAVNGSKDTVKIETKIINVKDAFSISIEKEELKTGLTILAITGAVLVIVAIIGMASSGDDYSAPAPTYTGPMSCPFVYSFDGSKFVFDAEPYGGAITEGLKKTDYNKLDNLKPDNGMFKLLMKNETDETQHTDEMSLLVIDHPENTNAACDDFGNMTIFSKTYEPVSAIDENGNDISACIKSNDDIRWQTNFGSNEPLKNENLRHELIIKFPKPKNAEKMKLLVNAGSGLWGGNMIKEMLSLYGNKLDNWYASMNSKGSEFLNLYRFLNREEIYSLKANVMVGSEWMQKGEILASSPMKFEDRIVELNIKDVEGDMVIIKLNPPYGFWEINQISAIYDDNREFEVHEVPVLIAKDENSNDVTGLLTGVDNKYYDMPALENHSLIYFDVPQQKTNTKRTVYLKTTGYYDIHLKKDAPPQTELINKIWNEPGFVVKYSKGKYFEYAAALGF